MSESTLSRRASDRLGGSSRCWLARALIAAIASCAGLLACGTPVAEPALRFAAAPIIIVDIDTLRADHLGCYGYSRPTSPNIDRFAESSFRFDWAFSQGPNTPPSQASLLTGLYPTTHGLINAKEDRLSDQVLTLAEVLAANGYRTAAFVDGGNMSAHLGLAQGFGVYDDRKLGLAAIQEHALSWLRDGLALRDDSSASAAPPPFLLLVHTYDVHTPYAEPPPFGTMFLDGLEPPTPGFTASNAQLEEVRLSVWTEEPRRLPENDLRWAEALYDGGIRQTDENLGRFFAQLDALGLLDRAIVVLISDHGEEFQEHGSVLHEKLYATVTRIPWLLRPPGGVEERVIGHPVEGVDLMPTLLEMVGVEVPGAVQGRSLSRLLAGGDPDPGDLAFGESPWFGHRRFVADSEYRLLLARTTGEMELFRYREDPLEQHDLLARGRGEGGLGGEDAAPRERARWLRGALRDWHQMVSAASVSESRATPLPEDVVRQLEALGYVD